MPSSCREMAKDKMRNLKFSITLKRKILSIKEAHKKIHETLEGHDNHTMQEVSRHFFGNSNNTVSKK